MDDAENMTWPAFVRVVMAPSTAAMASIRAGTTVKLVSLRVDSMGML